MKPLILLVCTLLLGSNLLAQNDAYKPIISPNISWDMQFGYVTSPNPICELEYGGRYFFNGDTIINDLVYYQLHKYPIISLSEFYCPPYAVVNSGMDKTDIFIREDTTERKVYIWEDNSVPPSPEYLLFDFNLEVGDTLNSYFNGGGGLIVDSIYMVTLENGETRRVWDFNSNYFPLEVYYIEGIGGNHGLFTPLPIPLEDSYRLICVKENDELLWGAECIEIYNSIEETLANPTQIYPNPTSTHLWINRKNATPATIQLININGQIVHTQKLTAPQSQINVSTLQKGIYFYKIGNGVQGKLLVE